LLSFNRYQVLSVDTLDESENEDTVEKDTLPRPPRIHLKSWEKRLPKKFIIASSTAANSLSVGVEVETTDSGIRRAMKALLDCGATGLFLDIDWVQVNNITTRQLTRPIPVYNVDGTPNEAGAIREVADMILRYNGHAERAIFAVTKLRNQDMILGFSWLREHNPEIDWQTGSVEMTRCPPKCDTCWKKVKAEK
jgi:hypothetical protein